MDVVAVAIIGTVVPAGRRTAFLGLRATAIGVGGLVGSVHPDGSSAESKCI